MNMISISILCAVSLLSATAYEIRDANIPDKSGTFKSRHFLNASSGNELGADHATPPQNQLLCQDQQETPEEAIMRQEKETRDVEKGVVGLEIAQGALEITLGAIRIAAAGTTADVLRREDNIASSRASLGIGGNANTPLPEILGPIRAADDVDAKRKEICGEKTKLRSSQADDPYSSWNRDFNGRMKRSPSFGPAFYSKSQLSLFTPTPHPRIGSTTINIPNLDEAERLLNLLENLLDTNNRVLRLLGIELPPITSSGSLLLKQYRDRVNRARQEKQRYGALGYQDNQDDDGLNKLGLISDKVELGDPNWIHESSERESPTRTFSDEITRLKRIRKVYKNMHRKKQ